MGEIHSERGNKLGERSMALEVTRSKRDKKEKGVPEKNSLERRKNIRANHNTTDNVEAKISRKKEVTWTVYLWGMQQITNG